MKNALGKIIYVWKSISLKARVNSYFNWKANLNFAKKNMVKQIKDIDYIETKNELEALVLETNLIKDKRPKYNILMKDDKNLTYIKISDDVIPEVYKTRLKTKEWQYFWPYPNTVNIWLIIDTLKKIFKLRSCKVKFKLQVASGKLQVGGKLEIISKAGRTIPCLDFYIWLCSGPCSLEKDKIENYLKNIDSLRDFLKWNTSKILKDLEEKMKQKAKKLEFEEAAKIKEQIKNINDLSERQIARDTITWNNDVLVFLEKYEKNFISVTEIRDWCIVWINNYKIENKLGETKEEIINFFIEQRYIESQKSKVKSSKLRVKNEKIVLITNEKIDDKWLLKFLKVRHILVENPKIGPKIDIINFTKNNLLNYAYNLELNEISKKTLTKSTMISILNKLGFIVEKKKEIIFECFDVSHISGNFTVASKSVIINWKSINSKYRKYKINSVSTGEVDDFKSIKEVIYRRSLEAIEKNNWPDLFIIDWGKGQLSATLEWVESWKLRVKSWVDSKVQSSVNLCSIAKREEEIFVPSLSKPILFEKWSPELMLIQKIRDEAHRFAISFHRSARSKAMKKNILEELPGFWFKTRQKLLKLAWNIDNIKNISREELNKILNKRQLEILEDYGLIS